METQVPLAVETREFLKILAFDEGLRGSAMLMAMDWEMVTKWELVKE
jgi:hypothetical protein